MRFFAVTITNNKGFEQTICFQAKTEAHALGFAVKHFRGLNIRFCNIRVELAHSQSDFEQGA